MSSLSPSDLQARIDAQAYPPTHTYQLDGLTPSGVLVERVARIDQTAGPDFWDPNVTGARFLDIGCSKGFFSLRAHREGFNVTGIDPDPEAVEICRNAAEVTGGRRRLTFHATTFRDMPIADYPRGTWDRIFVGNVHHYLYRDAGGWEWLAKLATMCHPGTLVVVEGPIGVECTDARRALPESLHANFTRDDWEMELGRFFTIRNVGLSPSYTPDRRIWLLQRNSDEIERRVLYRLKERERLSTSPGRSVFVDADGLVCKVYENPPPNLYTQVNLGRFIPRETKVVDVIRDDDTDEFVGWREPRVECPARFFEVEMEIFRAFCRRQVWLARNGYTDVDPGGLNFGVMDQRLTHFDKNSIHPIMSLDAGEWDFDTGRFFTICARNNRQGISEDAWREISRAMQTKDSHELERTYQGLESLAGPSRFPLGAFWR